MKNKFINIDSKYSLSVNNEMNFRSSIFNEKDFISLHASNNEKIFRYFLIENKTMLCKGIATFSKKSNNKIESPINGSYGGFEFSNNIYFDTKEKFINLVLEDLNKSDPKIINITLPPDIYNIENNSHQLSILLRNKFNIKNIEINQFINSKTYNIQKSVKSGNKKNIKKCLRKDISFRILQNKESKVAYQIILSNRVRKKYNISMTWEELSKMMNIFPDEFLNFGLFDDKEMIASAICIKISYSILYVFYWGELQEYQEISPIAFLSYKIIDFCKLNKISTLDLGTSSKNSIPNMGLINFKKSIGAISCPKYKLEKIINT